MPAARSYQTLDGNLDPMPSGAGSTPGKQTLTSRHVDRSVGPQAGDAASDHWVPESVLIAHDVNPLFVDVDPTTGDQCVTDLPLPIAWGDIETPAAAVDPWSGAPVFDDAYLAWDCDVYKDAFTSSWNDAQTAYAAVHALHAAGMRIDDQSGVRVPGANVDAARSFEDEGLRLSAAAVDPGKVGSELRNEILDTKAAIDVHTLTAADRTGDVSTALEAITLLGFDYTAKVLDLEIDDNDADVALENLDAAQVRRDLDLFKAEVKLRVETGKALIELLQAQFDPKAYFGALKQTASAIGASVEGTETEDANRKLAAIDRHVHGLILRKASLKAKKNQLGLDKIDLQYSSALRGLQKKLRDLEVARIELATLYRQLGQLMAKAGAASGMGEDDHQALAGAVEAVPQIDDLIVRIRAMQAGFDEPRYTHESGVGAGMATNADEFVRHVGVVAGTSTYLETMAATWETRRATVMATVDGVTR